jgi:hypothetical protein
MLVELTKWIERQENIVTCLALGNNKVANCYLTSSTSYLEVVSFVWSAITKNSDLG